ncbi:MAG TPA: hypothetical protein VIP70_12610 [Nitrososphaeraceae archaeon]
MYPSLDCNYNLPKHDPKCISKPCSAITAMTGAATGTRGEGEAESGEVNIKCKFFDYIEVDETP